MVPRSPPPTTHPGESDANMAFGLSLGGTLVSYTAIGLAIVLPQGDTAGTLGSVGIAGAIFAPSLGHWYSDKLVPRGLLLRGAGLVVTVIGALVDSSGCSLFYGGHGDPEPADCNQSFRTTEGTLLILAGAAMFVGGTIDDIVGAPRRAHRRNAALRATLAISPLVRHDGGGLALSGRF